MSDPIVLESTAQGLESFSKQHKVEQIEAVIRDFHLALDMREHAAGAGWAAMLKIQEILDMPWVQGAEQTRRREGK